MEHQLINKWKNEVNNNPDSFLAHYNLAVAYIKAREFEKAFQELKQTIKLNNKFVNAFSNMGSLLEIQNRHKEAIEYLEKANQISPDDSQIMYNLATAYMGDEKIENAKKLLEKVIEQQPNFVQAYNNLGFVYAELKEYEKAIDLYKKILKLNNKAVFAIYNIALAYKSLKELDKSLDYLLEYLKYEPDSIDTVNNIIEIFNEKYPEDKLIDKLLEIEKTINNSSALKTAIGLLYYSVKDSGQAKIYFNSAIDIEPTNVISLNNLGYILVQEDKIDEGIDLLEKAVLYNENYLKAHFNLAEAYERKNENNKAIELYEKILRLDSKVIPAIYSLGMLYYKTNKNKMSRDKLKQFIEVYDKEDEYYYRAKEILDKLSLMT